MTKQEGRESAEWAGRFAAIEQGADAILAAEGTHHVRGVYFVLESDATMARMVEAHRRVAERDASLDRYVARGRTKRHTPRQIVGGVWDGNMIRRARKAGPCEYTHCKKRIEVGDEYFEGEGDPSKAGGFGVERYCMDHLSEGDTIFYNRETGETTAPCPKGCAGGETPGSCDTCHGSGLISVESATPCPEMSVTGGAE